jgi:hypothetical protein
VLDTGMACSPTFPGSHGRAESRPAGSRSATSHLCDSITEFDVHILKDFVSELWRTLKTRTDSHYPCSGFVRKAMVARLRPKWEASVMLATSPLPI